MRIKSAVTLADHVPPTKQAQKRNSSYVFAVSLLVCTMASGCTINRVSILTSPKTRTPIQASQVKCFPSFKDIDGPWQLEGMISAYTLPIMSNTREKREALIKQTAADLGINAVIGLEPNIGPAVQRTDRSIGILANTGTAQQQTIEAIPKFIICLPPINFRIEKDPSLSKLDDYLREYVQYFFSYMKGYYVYRCNTPAVNKASVLEGNTDPAILAEPLGIVPDYVLLCDVDGYDQHGNIVVSRSRTLKITMTLFDLREKKVVWTTSTIGISVKSMTGAFLKWGLVHGPVVGLAGAAIESAESDDLKIVREAIMKAIDSVPVVTGFQGGTISPIDRN